MYKYELITIINQEKESFDAHKNFVTSTLTSNSINIISEKDMNNRELAYPINETRRGHYFLFNIEADPKNLIEVEKAFKLYKGLLRFMLVRQK